MEQYAYIRVSTRDQNVDRQLLALETYRLKRGNIFVEYQSGKDFNRPVYKKVIRKLKRGDLLIIKSIDRLGRNYNMILAEWQHITKDIQADILVLDMPLLDTRMNPDNLTGTLISDLVLQIFAYVAQTEREFILQRQAEGIAAAKAKGKTWGRKRTALPVGFGAMCEQCASGMPIRKAAQNLGMSPSTFYKYYKKWESKR